MTDRAVFGDFAQVARRHLAALAPGPGESKQLNPASVASQIREYSPDLSRILRVMSRYATDTAARLQATPASARRTATGPWRQAALQARKAMQDACLRSPFRPPEHPGHDTVRKTSTATRHLAAAADAMTIGRDLLQTHFTTGPGRAPRPCSEWSAMVHSPSGHRALLTELGAWAREIADHTEYLTTTPTLPGQEAAADQRRLAAIRRDLLAVARAADTARAAEPVSESDLRQLYATPLNMPHPRSQPARTESITSLCQGISSTAERVRRAFAAAVPDAAWSPDLTGESFRQATSLAAVVSQHSELIQQSLAGGLYPPFVSAKVRDSASVTASATRLWLTASRAWQHIETDTASTRTPPAITELADLVLWTGRLAHADPAWAPGLTTGDPATGQARPGFAKADLPKVNGALHQVTSALVAIAAADYTRTRTAAQRGRLLTPADPSTPGQQNQPFTRVSADQATGLLSTYRDAGAATAQASAALNAAAYYVRNYQKIPKPPKPPRIPPARRLDPTLPAAIAADRGGGKMPGPVERTLAQLGVTDPDYLSRGAALDQAASELIDQAAQRTTAQRWNTAITGRDPAAGTREIVDYLLARDQRRPAPPSLPEVRGRVPELQAEP